jgi:hypothetical protein
VPPATACFLADDQRKLAELDGVARMSFLRVQSVLLDPAQPRVTLRRARSSPADDPGRMLPLIGDSQWCAQAIHRRSGRAGSGRSVRSAAGRDYCRLQERRKRSSPPRAARHARNRAPGHRAAIYAQLTGDATAKRCGCGSGRA